MGRNTMRQGINNAMRRKLFSEFLKDKQMKTNFNPNGKNFYGKAKVETIDNVTKLYSYDTNVATYNHNTNEMRVGGWYSQTTAKHINAFLDYYGFDKCTKTELENYNN